MTKIDGQMLNEFRNDFAEAVKDLEAKYGIVISVGRISYTYDSFQCRIEGKLGDSKDDVMRKDFEKHCQEVGLYPDDYGQTFTKNGKQYALIGVDMKKRKYPVVIKEVSTGRTMRCTPAFVKSAD